MWESGREKISKSFQNLLKNMQISPCIPVLSFSFAELRENSLLRSSTVQKYLHRSQKEPYMHLNIHFTRDLKTSNIPFLRKPSLIPGNLKPSNFMLLHSFER